MPYTDAVSRASIEFLSKRQDRIEELFDRIASVQEDMSRLLVTNIERISDAKNQTDNINQVIRVLQNKIDSIEKILWQYVGVASFIAMAVTTGPILYKTFFSTH